MKNLKHCGFYETLMNTFTKEVAFEEGFRVWHSCCYTILHKSLNKGGIKMNNILLCCAAGMSTSLLVKKMEDEAKSKGIEVKIWAIGETDIYNNLDLADVILLGPQVRYRLAEVKEICKPKNIPVELVNTVDYGLMNGKKVLEHALKLIKDSQAIK